MDRTLLAQMIHNMSYITGNFTLRSGAKSNEYFDKYRFESNPQVLSEIANFIADTIHKSFFKFDYIGALEMGGIPIATALSLKTGYPLIFIRKKAKEYGTANFAEGGDVKNKNILLIEDIVTSGGQIIESSIMLREAGAIIQNAICVIDREAGGKEKLNENGIKLTSLYTMSELKSSVK